MKKTLSAAAMLVLLAATSEAQAPARRSRDEAFKMVEAYVVSNLQESLGLTDEQGWPRCATVRPPLIAWTVE